MNLMEQFLALSPAEKRRVHFALCEKALAAWLAYASQKKRIRYCDSVVGLSHKVDLTLPGDAFRAAQHGGDTARVAERYAEPIAAMQDDDLEFPGNIEFAYYSIYNLFCKYVLGREMDEWIIVNQAISAETDEARFSLMLSESMGKGIEPCAPPNGSPARPLGDSKASDGPRSLT